MSDEWAANTLRRIQQAADAKKQKEDSELMRERKLSATEHEMFGGLQESIKAAVEKLNTLMGDSSKQLKVDGERYNELEIHGPNSEVTLDLKFDFNTHVLNYDLYKGLSSHPKEGEAPLGFTETGEVCFIFANKPLGVERLAESLVDYVVNNSII